MSEKTFILVISGVFMMAWFEARTDELCLLVLYKKKHEDMVCPLLQI